MKKTKSKKRNLIKMLNQLQKEISAASKTKLNKTSKINLISHHQRTNKIRISRNHFKRISLLIHSKTILATSLVAVKSNLAIHQTKVNSAAIKTNLVEINREIHLVEISKGTHLVVASRITEDLDDHNSVEDRIKTRKKEDFQLHFRKTRISEIRINGIQTKSN